MWERQQGSSQHNSESFHEDRHQHYAGGGPASVSYDTMGPPAMEMGYRNHGGGHGEHYESNRERDREHSRKDRKHPDERDKEFEKEMELRRAKEKATSHIVLITHIPLSAQSDNVEQLIKCYSPYEKLYYVTSTTRSHCFVEFREHENAANFLTLLKDNPLVVDGKVVKADLVSPRDSEFRRERMKREHPLSTNDSKTPKSTDWICPACRTTNFARRQACFGCGILKELFPMADQSEGSVLIMRKLPNVDDDAILNMLDRYSIPRPVAMKIPRIKHTGVSQGFCFLQYESPQKAKTALNLVRSPLLLNDCAVSLELSHHTTIFKDAPPPHAPSHASPLMRVSDFTFVDTDEWQSEESRKMVKSKGLDPARYRFDASRGYFFDRATSYYYDPDSGFCYDDKTQSYLYFDRNLNCYIPYKPTNSNAVSASTPPASTTPAITTPNPADTNGNTAKPTDNANSEEVNQESPKDPGIATSTNKSEKKPKNRPVSSKLSNQVQYWNAKHKELVSEVAEKGDPTETGPVKFMLGRPGVKKKPTTAKIPTVSSVLPSAEKDETVAQTIASGSAAMDSNKNAAVKSSPSGISSTAAANDPPLAIADAIICFLCERQFSTQEQLERHKQLSQLHKQNLERQRAVKEASGKELKQLQETMRIERSENSEKSARTPTPSKGGVISSTASSMMEKMGWTPGQGLGAEKEGRTENLEVYRRSERKGLGADISDTPLGRNTATTAEAEGNDYKSNVKRKARERLAQLMEREGYDDDDEEEHGAKKRRDYY